MVDMIPTSVVTVTLAGPMLFRRDMAKSANGLGEHQEMQAIKPENAFGLERVIYESNKSLTELEPVLQLFSDMKGIGFILKPVTH